MSRKLDITAHTCHPTIPRKLRQEVYKIEASLGYVVLSQKKPKPNPKQVWMERRGKGVWGRREGKSRRVEGRRERTRVGSGSSTSPLVSAVWLGITYTTELLNTCAFNTWGTSPAAPSLPFTPPPQLTVSLPACFSFCGNYSHCYL